MENQIENTKNFNTGDLVYGLEMSRVKYNDIFLNSDSDVNISTIDQYPMTYMELKIKKDYGSILPQQNEMDSFINFISNHPKAKYIDVLNAKYIPLPNTGRIVYENAELNTGRKCKMGLEWAKENNKRVHFILDDIDMGMVVNKLSYTRGKTIFQKPSTGKELRELYRRQDDKHLLGNVHFWKDKKPVAAPWETESELWSSYKPKSWRTMSKADIAIDKELTSFL